SVPNETTQIKKYVSCYFSLEDSSGNAAPNMDKCFPFIVADIETVILNNVLVPYAAGLLVVNPGDDVAAMDDQIDTYFFEDYNLIIPSLEERSTKILETLAKTLCPHLGSKGSIAHDEIQCGYRGI
ncbi:hypothetical protein ACJX0J_004571, partial (mitochondrion) [Zea mays]